MQRLLIHIDERLRQVVDLDAVYYMEADEDDSLVRLRDSGRDWDL